MMVLVHSDVLQAVDSLLFLGWVRSNLQKIDRIMIESATWEYDYSLIHEQVDVVTSLELLSTDLLLSIMAISLSTNWWQYIIHVCSALLFFHIPVFLQLISTSSM